MDKTLLKQSCCKRAFLRGVFLCSGSVSNPEKGYHLEWATCQEIIAGNQEFMHQPWIRRDTEFIKMLAEGQIHQQL